MSSRFISFLTEKSRRCFFSKNDDHFLDAKPKDIEKDSNVVGRITDNPKHNYPLKVFLRIRPLLGGEEGVVLLKGIEPRLQYEFKKGDEEANLILKPPSPSLYSAFPNAASNFNTGSFATQEYRFSFSGLFGPSSSQLQVFESSCLPVIQAVLEGRNACLFCYGQTGSGKTFTMAGKEESDDLLGLAPRALLQLFSEFERLRWEGERERKRVEFSLKMTCIEIYNETAYDLLGQFEGHGIDQMPRVTVDGGAGGGGEVRLVGAVEQNCYSLSTALATFWRAFDMRLVACTPSNPDSSRSHMVTTLRVERREIGEVSELFREVHSRLDFVDLAGSERGRKKHRLSKQNESESRSINRSLHFLEQVISALKEQSEGKRFHVPYRNSLLTTVLKSSLGGNCCTALIATVPESVLFWDETLATAKFAQRCSLLSSSVRVNEVVDWKILAGKLFVENRNLKEENFKLKSRDPSIANVSQRKIAFSNSDDSQNCSNVSSKNEKSPSSIDSLLDEEKGSTGNKVAEHKADVELQGDYTLEPDERGQGRDGEESKQQQGNEEEEHDRRVTGEKEGFYQAHRDFSALFLPKQIQEYDEKHENAEEHCEEKLLDKNHKKSNEQMDQIVENYTGEEAEKGGSKDAEIAFPTALPTVRQVLQKTFRGEINDLIEIPRDERETALSYLLEHSLDIPFSSVSDLCVMIHLLQNSLRLNALEGGGDTSTSKQLEGPVDQLSLETEEKNQFLPKSRRPKGGARKNQEIRSNILKKNNFFSDEDEEDESFSEGRTVKSVGSYSNIYRKKAQAFLRHQQKSKAPLPLNTHKKEIAVIGSKPEIAITNKKEEKSCPFSLTPGKRSKSLPSAGAKGLSRSSRSSEKKRRQQPSERNKKLGSKWLSAREFAALYSGETNEDGINEGEKMEKGVTSSGHTVKLKKSQNQAASKKVGRQKTENIEKTKSSPAHPSQNLKAQTKLQESIDFDNLKRVKEKVFRNSLKKQSKQEEEKDPVLEEIFSKNEKVQINANKNFDNLDRLFEEDKFQNPFLPLPKEQTKSRSTCRATSSTFSARDPIQEPCMLGGRLGGGRIFRRFTSGKNGNKPNFQENEENFEEIGEQSAKLTKHDVTTESMNPSEKQNKTSLSIRKEGVTLQGEVKKQRPSFPKNAKSLVEVNQLANSPLIPPERIQENQQISFDLGETHEPVGANEGEQKAERFLVSSPKSTLSFASLGRIPDERSLKNLKKFEWHFQKTDEKHSENESENSVKFFRRQKLKARNNRSKKKNPFFEKILELNKKIQKDKEEEVEEDEDDLPSSFLKTQGKVLFGDQAQKARAVAKRGSLESTEGDGYSPLSPTKSEFTGSSKKFGNEEALDLRSRMASLKAKLEAIQI